MRQDPFQGWEWIDVSKVDSTGLCDGLERKCSKNILGLESEVLAL